MFKKIVILFITLPLHGMDQAPSYFRTIPLEIQNLIAYYLLCDDETEEEFITRMNSNANNDQEEFNLFFGKNNLIPNDVSTYCPAFFHDKTKVALILVSDKVKRELFVYHVDENHVITTDIRKINLCCTNYTAVAVSEFNHMFAVVKKVKSKRGSFDKNKYPSLFLVTNKDVTHILEVTQIDKSVILPKTYGLEGFRSITAAAFNRQGGQLIVRGVKRRPVSNNDGIQEHCILNLVHDNKKITFDKKPATNNLQNYFTTKYICKNLGSAATLL